MFAYLAEQEGELRERFNHARTLNELEDCAVAIGEFTDYIYAISPAFVSAYEEWEGEDYTICYCKPVCSVEEAKELVEVFRGEGFYTFRTPYYNRKFFGLVDGVRETSFDGEMAEYKTKSEEENEKCN